jgi:ATP-dependent protease ClpP protease subunit
MDHLGGVLSNVAGNQSQQAPPAVVYVSFSAEINPNTTESLLGTLANIANQNVPTVHLMISTPGGSVMHGINLYNVMRAMPFQLITHNVGNVDSIGNAVFLAGSPRYACEHSTFMFHGVGFDTPGAAHFEEVLLKERLAGVLTDQKRIAGIITQRTSLTQQEAEALFSQTQTKDATDAVGCGIVDEIRDAEIPAGAPIVSLVFQR